MDQPAAGNQENNNFQIVQIRPEIVNAPLVQINLSNKNKETITKYNKNTAFFGNLYLNYKKDEKDKVQRENVQFSTDLKAHFDYIKSLDVANNPTLDIIKDSFPVITQFVTRHTQLQTYILQKISSIQIIINADIKQDNPNEHRNIIQMNLSPNSPSTNSPKKSISQFIKELKNIAKKLGENKKADAMRNGGPVQGHNGESRSHIQVTRFLGDIENNIRNLYATKKYFQDIEIEYRKDLTDLNKIWKQYSNLSSRTIKEKLDRYYSIKYGDTIRQKLDSLPAKNRIEKLSTINEILIKLSEFNDKLLEYKDPAINASKKTAFPGYNNAIQNGLFGLESTPYLKDKNENARVIFNTDILTKITVLFDGLFRETINIKNELISTAHANVTKYIQDIKKGFSNINAQIKRCINNATKNEVLNPIEAKQKELVKLISEFSDYSEWTGINNSYIAPKKQNITANMQSKKNNLRNKAAEINTRITSKLIPNFKARQKPRNNRVAAYIATLGNNGRPPAALQVQQGIQAQQANNVIETYRRRIRNARNASSLKTISNEIKSSQLTQNQKTNLIRTINSSILGE